MTAPIRVNFHDLCEQAHAMAVRNGFWSSGRGREPFAVKLALIHSEVSEAVEALRRETCEEPPVGHLSPRFSAFEEELADIVIRVMDLAVANGTRLDHVIQAKVAFNSTRPVRHGGKAF